MQAFWITFEDGSAACCEGQSAYDAKRIAEELGGKKVAARREIDKPDRFNPEHWLVETLPYPARPAIWQFEHPTVGYTPQFCYRPSACAGKTSCPNRPCCVD